MRQTLGAKVAVENLCFRTNFHGDNALSSLTLCILLFATCSAALQEMVYRTEGFAYTEYFTLVTTLTYLVCGSTMMLLTRDVRKRSWRDYAFLASLSYAGLLFTNHALRHVSYTTRVVFKSSKVLPVKFLSYLSNDRRISSPINEWLYTVLLVLGISIFTADDFKSDEAFNVVGVVFLILAVCCDASCAVYEEKYFFRVNEPSSVQEVITFSSLWGSCYGVFVLTMSSTLFEATRFAKNHTYVTVYIVVSALSGFLSFVLILTVVKVYGATEAEIMKSLRRFCTMLMSFVVFQKRMGMYHITGIILVMIGTSRSFRLSQKRISKQVQLTAIHHIEPK